MRNRKALIFTIILGLMFSISTVSAIDYSSEESKWDKICSNVETAKDNIEQCQGYSSYLDKKLKDNQVSVSSYSGQIEKYKDDLNKQVEIAKGYEKVIEDTNRDIEALGKSVIKIEESIKEIEEEIKIREQEIEDKDNVIVDRMRKTQSDMRFGPEVDFLVKSESFATLLASSSIISDILDFESKEIEEIDRMIAKQKEDQEHIVQYKKEVENNIILAEKKKNDVVALKGEVDKAITIYQNKMEEIAILQSKAVANTKSLKDRMSVIITEVNSLETSGNFVRPIAGGYISARVWKYPAPWSATHIGYDYAAPVGTPIRAAANGVVLASYDNCPTIGHLGNRCGSPGMAGGGNQVFLLVTVNNELYAVTYFHMQSGSPIASGQVVKAGQTIGTMGSSGNSTGPHSHVEVIYLGGRTISQYISTWNGSLHHNIGMNLSNRCMDNGNTAPCRLDPGKVFGYN